MTRTSNSDPEAGRRTIEINHPKRRWLAYIGPSQLADSALDSGINILPINAFMIPTGAVAGAILTKIDHYKPLHWAGFGVLAISCGLVSMLSASTSTVAWAWFEILAGVGVGLPLTTQLPAIQAVLPETDTAISTSTYSFIRSKGFVWGATIPSIFFNSRIEAGLGSIGDPEVWAALSDGGAYSYALNIRDLTGQTLRQTLHVYEEALRITWLVGLAFALVGFLLVFVERQCRHAGDAGYICMEIGLEDAGRTRQFGADEPRSEA